MTRDWGLGHETDRDMFHGKHNFKGYYSAAFFCETFPVIVSDKVMKGYIRLYENRIPITFYTPSYPVAHPLVSMLEIEISRIITFIVIVSRET